jgi:membrane-associated phospholipid phosphatase
MSHPTDTSFPSDHATLAFAVAVGVYRFNRPAGITLLIFGVLVAIARVFVGAHYPSDVIGGAVLGTVTSALIIQLTGVSAVQTALNRLFAMLARIRLASA